MNAAKDDKVQLVLNGVEIHSDAFAAIYVVQADKVFITLADGTNAHGGWENSDSDITIVQNPEEVSAWCAQSPAIACIIDKEGNSENTQIDFGGNSYYDKFKDLGCVFWCWIFGNDPETSCDKW